jgi:DNA polymerase III epsilon subunit-like protein
MATKKSNRYTQRGNYDNFLRMQALAAKGPYIEIYCDTETGGIHAFNTEGPEYDKAECALLAAKGEDDIFLDDTPADLTADERRLASAIAGDDLLQLSAIKYRVENGVRTELEVMDLYIKNRKPIDPGASKVNHITEESLIERGAPTEADAFPGIREFFSDCDVFIAYNEPFDYGMLEALYIRNGDVFNPPLRFDVMVMNIDLFSMYKQTSRKLGDVAKTLGVVDGTEEFHNALDDIRVTVKAFDKMRPMYEAMPEPVDTSKFRTPRIRRHWVWKNPNAYKMIRIYFQTDCGKLYMEKLDRSFGTDGTYGIDELNMEGFIRNVLKYFGVERVEDLVHMRDIENYKP